MYFKDMLVCMRALYVQNIENCIVVEGECKEDVY